MQKVKPCPCHKCPKRSTCALVANDCRTYKNWVADSWRQIQRMFEEYKRRKAGRK